MSKLQITHLQSRDSRINSLYFKKDYSFVEVNIRPTSNCQLSSVGLAQNLKNYTNKELEIFFAAYSQKCGKTLMLLDLNEYNLKPIKKLLKPYYKKFNIKKYKSSNGSNMVLCNIYLDRDKLDINYRNNKSKLNIKSQSFKIDY